MIRVPWPNTAKRGLKDHTVMSYSLIHVVLVHSHLAYQRVGLLEIAV